ncbi:2-keto-4-pentenoate hydratase/2-oxohepta-3-ene-1,7-dioic acid hydratase in catechol pathway [Paraburkholderia sp. BL23I1N1]|uniref:fumarylacetoacetate hydrolase family protein n=1 Tax=Paraburkholderia sp. BL23I1N1 TaxID=1938802 RepID=UPI000E756091|nr:fumarylacetoacetate hydrolase family protein [Paraburkholderia sp. BL23I1N1]RKE38628.1 2-keto-4-pentenoate hydratase/2-oxohepta-3-ene-1,7-dioic acid hydratase in catechol pathway [Paraburkholderia sp. BL23I1N1]
MKENLFGSLPSRPVLIRYESERGARTGLLLDDRVYDLAETSGEARYVDMAMVLTDWPAFSGWIKKFNPITHNPTVLVGQVKLLAPLANSGSLYCAGANYSDHEAEMAAAQGNASVNQKGARSWHFLKSSHSMTGTGSTVRVPAASSALDWEVELAAVIGVKGKDLAIETALDHVAAYTIAIDFSARDLSRRQDVPERSPFRMDWLSHKSFDGACPIGPWLVPADNVPDPQNLDLSLSVNGDTKQRSNTSHMIFSLAEQIRDISERITLWPGDIILTGTPAGVGSSRGEFLRAADIVSAKVAGLGEVRVLIA